MDLVWRQALCDFVTDEARFWAPPQDVGWIRLSGLCRQSHRSSCLGSDGMLSLLPPPRMLPDQPSVSGSFRPYCSSAASVAFCSVGRNARVLAACCLLAVTSGGVAHGTGKSQTIQITTRSVSWLKHSNKYPVSGLNLFCLAGSQKNQSQVF